MQRILQGLVLLAMATICGCGWGADGPTFYTVSGNIAYDDVPIKEGQIYFLPEGGMGRPDACAIVDGRYELKCTAGKKRIEIRAVRPIPGQFMAPATADSPAIPAYEEYLPAQFNTKSTLAIEVNEKDSRQEFPFLLKSK